MRLSPLLPLGPSVDDVLWRCSELFVMLHSLPSTYPILLSLLSSSMYFQCWGVDSINAPDLREIKSYRLAKEAGQLDSVSIADNGRCGYAACAEISTRVLLSLA